MLRQSRCAVDEVEVEDKNNEATPTFPVLFNLELLAKRHWGPQVTPDSLCEDQRLTFAPESSTMTKYRVLHKKLYPLGNH